MADGFCMIIFIHDVDRVPKVMYNIDIEILMFNSTSDCLKTVYCPSASRSFNTPFNLWRLCRFKT